jgi:hypothetical protein
MEEVIQTCNTILDVVIKIRDEINNKKVNIVLDKYIIFLNLLKNYDKDMRLFYDFLKESYKKSNLKKAIHYSHYENYMIVLNFVILQLMNVLYDYLKKYNEKNIIYNETYKINWFEIITENYNIIINEFDLNLPCIEGYINKIENEINFINTPIKPINTSKIENNMTIEDFKDDGGFNHDINYAINFYDVLNISLKCFRKSLCSGLNNCVLDNETIKNAYNENNYLIFLKYINFYDTAIIKNTGYNENEIINIINNDIGGIDPDNIQNGKLCCLKDLKGGKKYTSIKLMKNV